jgi:hypothetical protein
MKFTILVNFIDHLHGFDKSCLSSSNARKWEGR